MMYHTLDTMLQLPSSTLHILNSIYYSIISSLVITNTKSFDHLGDLVFNIKIKYNVCLNYQFACVNILFNIKVIYIFNECYMGRCQNLPCPHMWPMR